MNSEYYEDKLANFYSEDDLLLHWGKPEEIIGMSNGNYIYEYKRSPISGLKDRYEIVPTNTVTNKNNKFSSSSSKTFSNTERRTTYKPMFTKQDCITRFVIDHNTHKIIKHSFTGRDCIAKKPASLIP